ncbi:MAG: zinc ribbon domain-containing protein [Chitinivibrionales bacterium]|nr:zinc ribbon domain-containing protein [Chitinivibrionales bacterium]
MPIFEYNCRNCGKEFEELVSFSGSGSIACPQCSSKNTQKKMSVFGAPGHCSHEMPCAASCPGADSCPGGSCRLQTAG